MSTHVGRAGLSALIAMAVSSASADVRACGPCGAGDTTLTSAGTEAPFAGRLRSALSLRYRTDEIGRAGIDRAELRELRSDLSLAWAPDARLFLIANMPLVHRSMQDVNLARTESWGPGELELGAKWFVLRERSFAPRWLVAALASVKLPTAPWRRDATGGYLPLEAQAGSGSLDVSVGPAASVFLGAFSAYASLTWVEPLITREPLVPGRSVRQSLAVQYQLGAALAARAAGEVRWDRPSVEDGVREPNSGGAVVFAGGDVLVSVLTDLLFTVGARWPVADRLRGAHVEGPVFALALIHDF